MLSHINSDSSSLPLITSTTMIQTFLYSASYFPLFFSFHICSFFSLFTCCLWVIWCSGGTTGGGRGIWITHTHAHARHTHTHTHTPLLHPVNQMLYCWHQTVYRPEEALLTEQWDRWVGHDLRCLVLVRYKHTHTHTLRCHSGESHRSRYWRRQTLSFCVSAARWLKLTSLWLCTNLCVCVCVCESGVLHQCCTSCSSSLLHQRAHHTTDMLVSDTLLFLKNICLMFHIQLQCWRKHSHPSLTVSISTTL